MERAIGDVFIIPNGDKIRVEKGTGDVLFDCAKCYCNNTEEQCCACDGEVFGGCGSWERENEDSVYFVKVEDGDDKAVEKEKDEVTIIKDWEDLLYTTNCNGLKISSVDEKMYSYEIIILDTNTQFYIEYNINKDKLTVLVDMLKCMGFKIEAYSFDLVKFLKENLQPTTFKEGLNSNCCFYSVDDVVYLGFYSEKIIGALYVELINDATPCKITKVLTENNVNFMTLMGALEDLEWF